MTPINAKKTLIIRYRSRHHLKTLILRQPHEPKPINTIYTTNPKRTPILVST